MTISDFRKISGQCSNFQKYQEFQDHWEPCREQMCSSFNVNTMRKHITAEQQRHAASSNN